MGLYEKLIIDEQKEIYPFHMPGHKRNSCFNMVNPYSIDITEIDGYDDLHAAEGILADIMHKFNKIYGAYKTYLLINGSTAGILAGMSACAEYGAHILIARNSHKSVYNAAYLRGFKTSYLYPEYDKDTKIAGQIKADSIKDMLLANPDIKLVVITSPTYEGVISDIRSIAETVHAAGAVLIVDGAHGAHLGFYNKSNLNIVSCMPDNAIDCGADIVIHSIHKTLPAFTQTALIHVCTDRVDILKLQRFLDIYQTSSPSYILMSGMQKCADFLENHLEEFKIYYERLFDFYKNAEKLLNIKLWLPDKNTAFAFDLSKLVFIAGDSKGDELYNILRTKYKLQPEMKSKDYIICMTSVCDTLDGFNRLFKAVSELDDIWYKENKNPFRLENINYEKPEQVFTIADTNKYEGISKLVNESIGEVSAEFVYIYPPGIPVIVPGERITKTIIEELLEYEKAGIKVHGFKDGQIRCVKF